MNPQEADQARKKGPAPVATQAKLSPSVEVLALAKDIYLSLVTNPANVGKTTEHLTAEAFEKADAFWAAADSRR